MNILVTGVSGLLGNALVEQLLADSVFKVTGIVHQKEKENIKTYMADILDRAALEQAFLNEKYDVVIHMAAISDYLSSTDKKFETFNVNMQGTINMLELFNKYCSGGLFIYTSSCKIYGKTNEMPISEKAEINSLTVVGKSKAIAEKIVDFYAQPDSKYLVVRPFNIFGGMQKRSFLIPTLVEQLKATRVLKLGNIYDKRDYIYVKDVAGAIISCIKSRDKLPQIEYLNIGNGTANSVEDILKIFEKILNIEIEVEVDKDKLRNDETGIEFSNCEKIKNLTGWSPRYTLEAAIREICIENQLIREE